MRPFDRPCAYERPCYDGALKFHEMIRSKCMEHGTECSGVQSAQTAGYSKVWQGE